MGHFYCAEPMLHFSYHLPIPTSPKPPSLCVLLFQILLFQAFVLVDTYHGVFLELAFFSPTIVVSRFICIVAGDRTLFLLWLNDIPGYGWGTCCLSMRPLMDPRVISTLWLLSIVLLWTCMDEFVHEPVFPFLLHRIARTHGFW